MISFYGITLAAYNDAGTEYSSNQTQIHGYKTGLEMD